MNFYTIFHILLIKLLISITNIRSQEVLGCGGFIKSHADIDFSKVEVKLLTAQGSVKDKTDCSPSNGYYFLPVYDKGDYILKISPVIGWSFEPDEIKISFDGKTDVCSLGKDVNFVFKGFGITGKVEVLGHNQGAKGVDVVLKSADQSDIRKTVTDANGLFYFTPVIPGTYSIKVSRNTWHFSKDEQIVIVKTGNTELAKGSFVVVGFDVNGKFVYDGNALGNNVGIVLFGKKGQKSLVNCDKTNVPQLTSNNGNFESSPLCFVPVNTNGDYLLAGVSPGQYLIKPWISNKNLKLHIQPEHIEFAVNKESLTIGESFTISGFNIVGQVLVSHDGWGVANAKVKLNGKEVTTTHTDGSYTLNNIKAGTYTIQVVADNLQFNDNTVKITLSDTALPDIIVASFKVCGQVISQESYTIAVTKHASTFHTQASTAAGGTGEWCTYLPNGRFSVEVLTSSAEKASGIQFFPLQQNIEVNSSPVSGIIFSQLRATVSGEVECLKDLDSTCNAIIVTLYSLDSEGRKTGQHVASVLENGKYSFTDVLPGSYEVAVPNLYLCWESITKTINVKSATETVPKFVHNGYLVSVISSHSTKMQMTLNSNDEAAAADIVHTIDLNPGLNSFCAKKYGQYAIKFIGCHSYDSDDLPTHINIAEHAPITINAVKHRNGVRILSEVNEKIKLLVQRNEQKPDDETTIELSPDDRKIDGYHAYSLNIDLKPEERIVITPQSGVVLFKPDRKTITGGHDCVDVLFTFIGTKGLIIDGKIVPAIPGVSITLSFPRSDALADMGTTTNSLGAFRFGPLDAGSDYEITAFKESYVFSDFDKSEQIFKAHKLCEIIARVNDESGQRLPGVLLSLSGAESYRKNLVTGEDGTIKFHSLSPSQYYLRPMMKEYKFEPSSKIIDVKDGETIDVELNGKRVAFSIFGSVKTLNGDPSANAIIEAVALEPCEHHQEEATSESNGNYRIRGLQPGCAYSVYVKKDKDSLIDRTIPKSHTINVEQKDVRDVNIIAITAVSAADVVARVFAHNNEHYKTLRIQMYAKGNAASPIYSQRIEPPLNIKSRINPGSMVFFPRIPVDGKTYSVELTSTLSENTFKYDLPIRSFTANRSSIFVELDFKPEIRSTEHELNQNSLSALLLIGLVAVAFFKQDLAVELLHFVWNRLVNLFNQYIVKSGQANKKKDNRQDVAFDEDEIEKLAQSINATKKKSVRRVN